MANRPLPDDDDDGGATRQRDAMDDLPPDLPDAPPADLTPPPMPRQSRLPIGQTLGGAAAAAYKPSTETQFQAATMEDSDPSLPSVSIELSRSPAPTRQRPTLLPSSFDQPPKLPGATKTAEPGLLKPVRPAETAQRGPVNLDKESSDVINMYDTGGAGEPKRASLHHMAPPRTAIPGGGLQPVQPVPPAPQNRAPVRRSPTAPPAAPARMPAAAAATSAPLPAAMAQGPLPLNADVMLSLIASHRSRMASLDMYARGLEVCAGVLGAMSAGFLIASLVALLVGSGVTLLAAAAALVSEVAGVCLAVAMLALASALRHLASTAAQQAALLEALSSGR